MSLKTEFKKKFDPGCRNFERCELKTVHIKPFDRNKSGEERRSIGVNWGEDTKKVYRAELICPNVIPFDAPESISKDTQRGAVEDLMMTAGQVACSDCPFAGMDRQEFEASFEQNPLFPENI